MFSLKNKCPLLFKKNTEDSSCSRKRYDWKFTLYLS